MTMDAALKLSGDELPGQDGISETIASLALKVWPDVTPRDLVTLGTGVRYAYAVLTEGVDADIGVEAFGIDLSGHGGGGLLRLCAGGGE